MLNADQYSLQWGRGFETAETQHENVTPDDLDLLQWGRGFETAETTSNRPVDGGGRPASMGPRF